MSMQHERGFTIVETLIAITIILLVITGAITTAQKGLQSSGYANEQITAVFLAQEALEAVRMKRDTQALNAYHASSLPPPTSSIDTANWVPSELGSCGTNGCAVTFGSSGGAGASFQVCSTGGCKVYFDSNAQKYTQESTGNSLTKYTRKIFVTNTGGNVEVAVKVSWDGGTLFSGATREVTLHTWIYDQYSRYE